MDCFKDNLKTARKNKGISQKELGEALFLSRSVVAKWESGVTVPSVENLKAINDYFNLDNKLKLDEDDERYTKNKGVVKVTPKEYFSFCYKYMLLLLLCIVAVIFSLVRLVKSDEYFNGDVYYNGLKYHAWSEYKTCELNEAYGSGNVIDVPEKIYINGNVLGVKRSYTVVSVSLNNEKNKELVIPKTVESIQVFSSTFSKVTVAKDNKYYSSVDNCLLYGTELIYACRDAVIPDYITAIRKGALLDYCTANFTIPRTVKKLEENSMPQFVKSVILPATLEEINYAFYYSSHIEDIFTEDSIDDFKNKCINNSGDLSQIYGVHVYYYSLEKPLNNGNYWHYDSAHNAVKW